MSISACDTNSSILLNLFFTNNIIFASFFFLFFVTDKTFLIIPINIELTKANIPPAVRNGMPITLPDDAIHTPLDNAVNPIKILST